MAPVIAPRTSVTRACNPSMSVSELSACEADTMLSLSSPPAFIRHLLAWSDAPHPVEVNRPSPASAPMRVLPIICPTPQQVQWISGRTVRHVRSDPSGTGALTASQYPQTPVSGSPGWLSTMATRAGRSAILGCGCGDCGHVPQRLQQLRVDGTVAVSIDQMSCTTRALGRW